MLRLVQIPLPPLESNMSATVPRGFPTAWGDVVLIKGIMHFSSLRRCWARWLGPGVLEM